MYGTSFMSASITNRSLEAALPGHAGFSAGSLQEQSLVRAFVSFTEAASSLERSYTQLQGEVARLRRELVEFRALGEPLTVTARPWARGPFRLSRGYGRSAGPPPRPFDVEVTFAEPVAGPVVLGRHAHFSLGLMIPNDV